MYKIKKTYISEIEIKKSSFISYLIPIENEQDAKNHIQALKKQHPNAAHHCYALIVGEIQRSNDDGEPGNSAGIPILKELIHSELTNVLCVVVRYFGGIKLGVGGLIRAYSKSAKESIEICEKYQQIPIKKFEIRFEYAFIDKIEYLLKAQTILQKSYDEQVTYQYLSNDDFFQTLQEITSGNIQYTFLSEEIMEVKI